MENEKKLGLCQGRHEIPHVTEYIFEQIDNVTNVINLENDAISKLEKLFLDKEIKTINLSNQADYTDIPVIYRGKLNLYVTGLTVALIAVLNACKKLGIEVILYHFNSQTGEYFPQKVL